MVYSYFKSNLRWESHYGKNDGNSDIAFHRSHFTYCALTNIIWSRPLEWLSHRHFSVDLVNEKVSDGCKRVACFLKYLPYIWQRYQNVSLLTLKCWRSYFFRSLGESFPCFFRKGTHLSPRIPALLKLPRTVEEITGNESVAGRQNKQEGWPKQHWQCCAALVQTLIAIQNVSSTLTMVSALVENGARLWNREKTDSQKYNVCHFLFVLLWRRDQLFAVTFHTMIVTVTIALIFAIVWILLYHNVKKCNCN